MVGSNILVQSFKSFTFVYAYLSLNDFQFLPSVIKMPSKQYYLEVKDRKICRLDMQTSMATAQELGTTEIVLKDRSILTALT